MSANDFKTISLTHQNLKRPVTFRLGAIAFYNVSEIDGASWTNVFTNAGVCPVTEAPATITKLIQQAIAWTPATSSTPHAGPSAPPESEK